MVNIYSKTSLLKYTFAGRGFLTPYFMKTPLCCLPYLYQILSNLSPALFCCLVSLTEWVIMPHLMCYFLVYDIMDLHMSSLGTLVLQRFCGMFHATWHQFTEFYHMTWFFAGTLIWHHKRKWWHTTHTGANRLRHSYKYMLSPPAMCSKQLSVLHWMNNLLISKFYITEFNAET